MGDTKSSQRKYLSGLDSGQSMARKGMTGTGPKAPEFPDGLESHIDKKSSDSPRMSGPKAPRPGGDQSDYMRGMGS